MSRVVLIACALAAGCAGGRPEPSDIRLGSDACASCRMTLLSLKTAAQVISPGGEPLTFDDIGCLRDYIAASPLPDEPTAFVADHRTGAWVEAAYAVYTQTREPTPMGSGLVAHADALSRDADAVAAGGTAVSADRVLGSLAARSGR